MSFVTVLLLLSLVVATGVSLSCVFMMCRVRDRGTPGLEKIALGCMLGALIWFCLFLFIAPYFDVTILAWSMWLGGFSITMSCLVKCTRIDDQIRAGQ